MAVRPCPKHDNCWIVDWRPQGRNGPHPQRHITGTEAEANAFWLEAVTTSRRHRGTPAGHDPKVIDIIAEWQEEYRNDHLPTTVQDLKHCMVHLVRYFGKHHLSEIGPALIERYKGERLATEIPLPRRKTETEKEYKARKKSTERRTISKKTINKELAYLSSFFKWCLDREHIDQPIRVKRFPPRQTGSQRVIHPLGVDEMKNMIDTLEPHYRCLFLLMNDAGLRRSEALHLTAEQVLLSIAKVVVFGKGGKIKSVDIPTNRLWVALSAAIDQTPSGELFVNPKTGKPWYGIRKALIRAAKKVGIKQDVYHHLLRHSHCTAAMESGANVMSIKEQMRHASVQTTQGYVHVSNRYKSDDVKKIGRYLEGGQDETGVVEIKRQIQALLEKLQNTVATDAAR